MYQSSDTWEASLHTLALKAQHSTEEAVVPLTRSDHVLRAAYAYCEELTARHSRSFHFASRLLPDKKRLGARALCFLPRHR